MNLDENLGFIGLARKAGCLEIGSEAAEFALSKGKAKLIILSGDAGRSTIGKFASICEAKSVPMVRASTKEKLGRILGRSQVAVAAVTEVHFAKKMLD